MVHTADPEIRASARERPAAAAALDLAALLGVAGLASVIALRVAAVLDPPRLLLPLVAVPLGVLAADLVSGVAHWLADRVLDARTPLLGPLLIQPFREHHDDPLAITRHGFLETNGNNALAVAPALALAAWLGPVGAGGLALFGDAFVLALALAVLATNQLHKWAHAPRVPRAVAWLQAHRLVLPPAAHARHHGGAHASAYCVTTGWWNPLLDATGLLARLEARLRAARDAR